MHKEFSDMLALQFTNNTLLFCAAKHDSVLAAKAILLVFKAASSLNINVHKSSIICINMDEWKSTLFAS